MIRCLIRACEDQHGINPNCQGKKQMSMDELATHCKPGDYFIALYGQIIDVSNFISKHPGGEKILKATAGKDATQKFESIWVFAFVITFLFYVHCG